MVIKSNRLLPIRHLRVSNQSTSNLIKDTALPRLNLLKRQPELKSQARLQIDSAHSRIKACCPASVVKVTPVTPNEGAAPKS